VSLKTLLGLVLAAFLAIGGSLLAAGSASAATAGNPADNVHFTLVYSEGTSVPGHVVHWDCAGERINNNGQGIRDVEECTLTGNTGDYVPGRYGSLGLPPNPNYGPFPGFPGNNSFFWFSDFDGKIAVTWSIVINGASNHAHISASY
jgi:hypothetical protein